MMCTIFLNSGSWEAALLAVGTMLSAMRYLLDEYGKIAYALIKPLGHHAQPTLTDRYCILNHAGLAVQLALDSGVQKWLLLTLLFIMEMRLQKAFTVQIK